MADQEENYRMTFDDEGRLVSEDGSFVLPADTTIWVPDKIPVKFVMVEDDNSSEKPTFQQLYGKYLDDPVRGNSAYCLFRNCLRLFYWNHIQRFSSLDSLLGKNLVFLQLVLVDPNREIQEKMYQGPSRQNPKDQNMNVTEQSRHKFKEIIPCLLQGTTRWVFSRSLVIKDFNKALCDEALLKLLSHDPVGGLKKITFDLPLGVPDSQVSKQRSYLMAKAVEEYKDTPVPLGICCTEVFLFVAGDFALGNDGDLNSRKATRKLLRYLYTEEGIQKVHGFDEMAFGCSKVSPEKIALLKDVHLTS